MAGWRSAGRGRIDRSLVALVVVLTCTSALSSGMALRVLGRGQGDIAVGAVQDLATTMPASTREVPVADPPPASAAAPEDGPGIRMPAPVGATPPRPTGRRLLDPTGRPYGAPVPFDAQIPVPGGLVWVLLIGSDARAGEDPMRARADSIHLLAANPATGQATILGFPRDSFVEIPDHGAGKINTALVSGGPELLARTVHRFTGLPVQYWAVAGFEAFTRVVDEVGGVDVLVPRRMDDWDSGAHFQPGYHHFDGAQALAFSRDRHDFADGDLSRSHNQGEVVIAALAKLRAEVGDEGGLLRWLGFAFRHLEVDVDRDQALQLLAVARRTDPADVGNIVLPGQGGVAGSQSVVYLDPRAAAALVDDLRPDAAIGPAKPVPTTTTQHPTTTTTQPAATTTGAPPPGRAPKPPPSD